MKRLLNIAIPVLLWTYFLLPNTAAALSTGVQAPTFTLPVRGGGQQSLSALKGKVVYLDFWASWCGPCKHTLPWMNKLEDKYKKQGLEVVAVNVDTESAAAETLLNEVKPSYLIMFDSKNSVISSYSPPKMPTSFLIDRSGNVVAIFPGFSEGDEGLIEQRIEEVLANS